MKNRTLVAISHMMGLLLLPLGCVTDPPLVLQPTELCSDHRNSDIVTFEDPNMERAVRGPRNGLTCDLASAFQGISLTGYGITSLMGIQNLTSLESLDLRNMSITDINPLSGLTGLVGLRLGSNLITDISALSGLTRLRSLRLSNNPDLADIQRLLDNPGLGPINPGTFGGPDLVTLRSTSVSGTDVAALKAKGVSVGSDCP